MRSLQQALGQRYVIAFKGTTAAPELSFLGWIYKKDLQEYLEALPMHGLQGFVDFDHEVDKGEIVKHLQGGGALSSYRGAGKLWIAS